jgi:hypothetical protein
MIEVLERKPDVHTFISCGDVILYLLHAVCGELILEDLTISDDPEFVLASKFSAVYVRSSNLEVLFRLGMGSVVMRRLLCDVVQMNDLRRPDHFHLLGAIMVMLVAVMLFFVL